MNQCEILHFGCINSLFSVKSRDLLILLLKQIWSDTLIVIHWPFVVPNAPKLHILQKVTYVMLHSVEKLGGNKAQKYGEASQAPSGYNVTANL